MNHKQRFLILTSDSGFGHRSVANSIAKALELLHPQEAVVSIVNPIFEQPTALILRKTELNYDNMVRDYPSLYRLAYEISDSRSASSLVEATLKHALQRSIQQIIGQFQPDAILNTNQMFNSPTGATLRELKIKPPFFTIVTDLADVHSMWFNSDPDLFFVASEAVKAKAISSGIPDKDIVITGIPVDPAFCFNQESKYNLRCSLGLDPNLTTLLIVGSQRVKGIYSYLKALEKVRYPFQVVVITGGDNALYTKLGKRSWHFPTLVKNYVTNIPDWMISADLLITKAGGLILSEGLAAGLPIVLINNLPGQEEGNVRYILENNAGILAGTPAELITTMNSWLSDGQSNMNTIKNNSRRLGHPSAALSVSESLWQATSSYAVSEPFTQSEIVGYLE
ncbi:MAG: MGDG synthase family glycosyltransferase [Anaerolineaceae bacterium]